jgi:hypothetical protein
MKLYHYTKFDTFIYHILPKMELRLGPLEGSNDPIEFSPDHTLDYNVFTQKHQEQISKEFRDRLKHYKFLSFCRDAKNLEGYRIPPMWAHYAENHNGVCIELDSSKLPKAITSNKKYTGKRVSYKNKIYFPTINSFFPAPKDNEEVNNYIDRGVTCADNFFREKHLFRKLPVWKYENEYRIVYRSSSEEEVFIDIKDAIKTVYLGIRAARPQKQKFEIVDFLLKAHKEKTGKEITLLTMNTSNSNDHLVFEKFDWKDYWKCVEANREFERKYFESHPEQNISE